MAASAEECAFGIGSQWLYITIVVLHETYFYSPVIAWGTYETYAVAREGVSVKLNTDVEVLSCCTAKALTGSLAWIKVERKALSVIVLLFE